MNDGHQHCACVTGTSPDVRILRRLNLCEGSTGVGDPDAPFIGVVIDCETTGLNASSDEIIELACRRFRYDRNGVITKLDKPYSWLEQSSIPIPKEVTRITGLVDADVVGRRIDDALATKLIASADYRIAHNAAFDRKFVERRLPGTAGLAWACSCSDVDWSKLNLDGKKLGWLLAQIGWFFDAHRAIADVDAVIALLAHNAPDGHTMLSSILERADELSWTIGASGASFDVKDMLKQRGYGWDSVERIWSREVLDRERVAEEDWLATHIYAISAYPRASGPVFTENTSLTRYA